MYNAHCSPGRVQDRDGTSGADYHFDMRKYVTTALLLSVALLFWGCKSKSGSQGSSAPNEFTSGWKIDLKVTPDHPRMVQPVTFTVHILDASGKPVDDAKVTGELTMAVMDMGKNELTFESKGEGNYEASKKDMDMAGPWELTVQAAQGTFHALKKFEVVIYE